jgi:murein L,D-transpeptidase YafK
MVSVAALPRAIRTGVAATLCALWLAAPSTRASGLEPGRQTVRPMQLAAASTAAPAPQPALNAAIQATVTAWAQAWSAKDVERYLAFYAPAFKTPGGEPRAAWEELRRKRVAGPNKIQVSISGVDVLRRDDARAAVTFRQRYRSDRFQGSTRKALELVRDGKHWLIVEERVIKK